MVTEHLSGNNSAELLEAQAHVWNHIFKFIDSMSLKSAIELGILDAVHSHGHPITLPELVAALPSIDREKAQTSLPRLMRILVHSGFFTKTSENGEQEAYTITPASSLLLKNSPFSIRPYLLAVLDPILMEPWQFLGRWFQNRDATPFETTHARTIWDYASSEPRLNKFINDSMANDTALLMTVVLEECKGVFDGLKTLVDVGGGTGAAAKAITAAFPELECTVFDLPHVVDGLQGHNTLQFVGVDMFETIPSADAAMLKWVLHNWNDEDSVKILKQCKKAIRGREEGGKVIVIDTVIGSIDQQREAGCYHHDDSLKTQLLFDMLMMTELGGQERREEEWAKLFNDAGFKDYKIIRILGIRALIELYP